MNRQRGLVADLIKAKLQASTVISDDSDQNPKVTPFMEVEAKGISEAFLNFLTHEKLNLTVSELRASVELEEFSIPPQIGDVLPSVTVTTSGGPGTVSVGTNGVQTKKIDVRRDGGPTGRLKAVGHAHIGLKDPVPNSDTTDNENDFTKVKLYRDKIPKEIL
jgi:hypothetical protein